MNQKEILELLDKKHIIYEIMYHEAVYRMDDASLIDELHPDAVAKNLFVCDDKKRNYYLITVKGMKRMDLKAFHKKNGLRPLHFAKEEELLEYLQLHSGAVSPFGLLNDKENIVHFFIDKEFLENNLIGIHPNDNTATVWLKVEDLIILIQEHGNEIKVVTIE